MFPQKVWGYFLKDLIRKPKKKTLNPDQKEYSTKNHFEVYTDTWTDES